jgi:hypothetical protein
LAGSIIGNALTRSVRLSGFEYQPASQIQERSNIMNTILGEDIGMVQPLAHDATHQDVVDAFGVWINPRTLITKIKKNRYKNKLEKIVSIAIAHRKDGLVAGDPVYQTLWADAESVLASYCALTGESPEDITAEIPTLSELNTLAISAPPAMTKMQARTIGVFVLSIGGSFTLGILYGFAHEGFRLIHFLFRG